MYRCYKCGVRLPRRYPRYRDPRLHAVKFKARVIRRRVTALFPSTGIRHLSFSATHAHTTCRQVVTSFRGNGARVLVKARVLSGNLSFKGIDIINVLGTSDLVGFPSFHTRRHTFRLVMRIDNHTKEQSGQKAIILRASRPSRPLVEVMRHFTCGRVMHLRLNRQDVFHCPPCCHLVIVILHDQGSSVLRRLSILCTRGLHHHLNRHILNPIAPPVAHIRALRVQGVILGVRVTTTVTPMHRVLRSMRARVRHCLPFGRLVIRCSMSPT